MTHSSPILTRFSAALFLLSVQVGCPDTKGDPVQIDTVEPEASTRTNPFTLIITGRGFGLKGLAYDLSNSRGSSEGGFIQVRIKDSMGTFSHIARGPSVVVESPRKIRATINTQDGLEAGIYGVEILLDSSDGLEVVASLDAAFEVPAGLTDAGVPDAGFSDAGDGGLDAGVDTGVLDAGGDAGDVGSPDDGGDAGPPDTGPADTGPVDSGLGPFIGAFGYRQAVVLTNTSNLDTPADITVRIPVPHEQLINTGRAKGDGSDLVVFAGANQLNYSWDDRLAVGTNQAAMIVRLNASIPAGASETLALYYGDINTTIAPNDNVFDFVQRFDAQLPGGWFANTWLVACNGRTQVAGDGAVCVIDSNDNPTRRTVGSPNQAAIRDVANTPANVTYEMSTFIVGRMDEVQDILYFAYSDQNDDFANALLLNQTDYFLYPPLDSTMFVETNNQQRLVVGWRLPASPGIGFTRTMARFVPQIDQPSLHMRYISPNGTNNTQTLIGVEDWWIRRALDPDFDVQLGPVETP